MTLNVMPKRTMLTFPSGLPGFEACHRFVLLQSPDFEPGLCLKGIDAPEPAFFLMDPQRLDEHFVCELSAADRARLRASTTDRCVWMVVVAWDEDAPRINWRAPIVINPSTMLGIQLLPSDATAEEHTSPLEAPCLS